MTIKEYVMSKNINYSDLANLIPCTPQFVSMMANDKARPSFRMAKRIEEVTNGHVKKENWFPNE